MKIELIPAIDIIGGKCVRLTKGDYDQKTVYGKPIDMAKEFERIGFNRLHVVDLDGAKSRHIVNDAVLREITSNTKLTDILKEYPWLPDELVKLDGRLGVLKTPVGKMMIKNMNIADVSKKVNFPENDVINQLKKMITEHNS